MTEVMASMHGELGHLPLHTPHSTNVDSAMSFEDTSITRKPPPMTLDHNLSASTPALDINNVHAAPFSLHSSMQGINLETAPLELFDPAQVLLGYPYWMQEGRFKWDTISCHVKGPDNEDLRFANRYCIQYHPSLSLFTTELDFCCSSLHQLPDEHRALLYQMGEDDTGTWKFIPDTCQTRLFPPPTAEHDPHVASILASHSAYNAEINGASWKEANIPVDHIVALMPDGRSVNYGIMRSLDGVPASMCMTDVMRTSGGCLHGWIPQIINSLLIWNEGDEGLRDLYWQESCEISHQFFDDENYAIYMFYNSSPPCDDNIYGTAPANAYAAVIAAIFGLIQPTEILEQGQALDDGDFHVPAGPAFFVKVDKTTGSICNLTVADFRRIFSSGNISTWIRRSTAYKIIEHYITSAVTLSHQSAPTTLFMDVDVGIVHGIVYKMAEQYAYINLHSEEYVQIREVICNNVNLTHCTGRSTANSTVVNPLKMDRGFLASAIVLLCCSSFAFPVYRPSPLFELPTRKQFHMWYESDCIMRLADTFQLTTTTTIPFQDTGIVIPEVLGNQQNALETRSILCDSHVEPQHFIPNETAVPEPSTSDPMVTSTTTSPETLKELIIRAQKEITELALWSKDTTLPHSIPEYRIKKRKYKRLCKERNEYRKRYKSCTAVSVTLKADTFAAAPSRKRKRDDTDQDVKRRKMAQNIAKDCPVVVSADDELEALATDTTNSIIVTATAEAVSNAPAVNLERAFDEDDSSDEDLNFWDQ